MKKNPEFDNFTAFMDKLAKVPHSEVKAGLDAERIAKKRRRKTKRALPEGSIFLRERGSDPVAEALADVNRAAARRRVN